MTLAKKSGLEVAQTSFRYFNHVPALIVQRYDRIINQDGKVARLHQEDFCQALGISPSHKYTSDGGPTASDCVQLLIRYTSDESVYRFIEALLFNYLICGTDAHAKNYSLIHYPSGEVELAPLYDIASYLPYRKNPRQTIRLAMSIGGENRFGKLGPSSLERFSKQNNLDYNTVLNLANNVASRIYASVDEMETEFENKDILQTTTVTLLHDEIKKSCESFKRLISN